MCGAQRAASDGRGVALKHDAMAALDSVLDSLVSILIATSRLSLRCLTMPYAPASIG